MTLEPAGVLRAGPVGDARRRVEHAEEFRKFRRLQKEAVDEIDDLDQLADEHRRQRHEGDELADRREAPGMEPDADDEDREQRQRRGRSRRHHRHRPPGEHRQLRVEHRLDEFVHREGFALDAGEALDDGDIAEHVRGALGKVGVETLDLRLQRMGAANDEDDDDAEDRDEDDKRQAEPPVDEKRQRQQHGEGDEIGAFLAEEREPEPEEAGSTLEHPFQQPAGMDGSMEGKRQVEHMLEIGAHRGETPPMGHPVGTKADEDRADDREQGEADPGADQRRKLPDAGAAMQRFADIHPVDDAAEEDRLGELRGRQGEIGKGEKDRHMSLAAEQAQGAEIEPRQRSFLNVVFGLGHALQVAKQWMRPD